MGLAIDTARGIRGTAGLTQLVAAVSEALEPDEADWIEWKSTLDLSSKAGAFAIARAVLGFSNRQPATAGLNCEGVAYLLIGVTPGQVEGVAEEDPAQLSDRVDQYVGGMEGPQWTPTYVRCGDRTVLVVTVEPPRLGDPIFVLRKEFDRTSAATVFVRAAGRTRPATPVEFDELQKRARAGNHVGKELSVELTGGPVVWIDAADLWADIDAYTADRSDALLEDARLAAEGNPRLVTGWQGSLGTKFFGVPSRTTQTFRDEVLQWVKEYSRSVSEEARSWAAAHGLGAFRVEVANSGSRPLEAVEVHLYLPDSDVAAFDDDPTWRELAREPAPLGESERVVIPRFHTLSIPDPYRIRIPLATGQTTLLDDGTIELRTGDLRPGRASTTGEVRLVAHGHPSGGRVTVRWRATAGNTEGVASGEFLVPVAADALTFSEIFADEPER